MISGSVSPHEISPCTVHSATKAAAGASAEAATATAAIHSETDEFGT